MRGVRRILVCGRALEVLLPRRLADCLEARQLDAPVPVVERGVRYLQRYDICGGHAFSASFSRASIEALGWHGLGHRFAKEGMRELMHHAEHRLTLVIVPEEMGHLRPDITLTYFVKPAPVQAACRRRSCASS